MKLLVFGKNGQIASELQSVLNSVKDKKFLSSSEANFLNVDTIVKNIREYKPTHIVNAAAYTAVDKAESDEMNALQINALAVGVIAEEAKKLNSQLIHYSTDYVFDGAKNQSYSESDKPNSINVYGRSKLAGEQSISSSGASYVILRVSWIYGNYGNNFFKTMLRLGAEKEELKIVVDQVGCPTWSNSIAQVTSKILFDQDLKEKSGIYHFADEGTTSWHGFAQEIFNQYRILKPGSFANLKKIAPINSIDFKTAAARPLNSRLNCEKIKNVFGVEMKSWSTNLQATLKENSL